MTCVLATAMPLQPCRECRHAVSTEALACPSCGAAHPAGASAAALALREPGAGKGGGLDGPTPAFWRAVRLLLKRVRIGLYGLASALLAALLTGSLVQHPPGGPSPRGCSCPWCCASPPSCWSW